MSNPSYRRALEWIADMDDTTFLDDAEPSLSPCVTLSMVADLWGRDIERAVSDLQKTKRRLHGSGKP